MGPSSTFLLNHMAALRDPESGNNNYLSFTRSEHLDSIAGPPGAGLPEWSHLTARPGHLADVLNPMEVPS
jgi:hypothetical protein